MTVACPHCRTRYELPESLLGPGGARVRCPRCRESFTVARDGRVAAASAGAEPGAAGARPGPASVPAAEPGATAPPATAPPVAAPVAAVAPAVPVAAAAPPAAPEPEPEPLDLARAALAEVASAHGVGIEDAIRRGRLFSEHGQRLMEAYDAYRRRAGRRADAGAFREALRERWGVDLTPRPDDSPGAP